MCHDDCKTELIEFTVFQYSLCVVSVKNYVYAVSLQSELQFDVCRIGYIKSSI